MTNQTYNAVKAWFLGLSFLLMLPIFAQQDTSNADEEEPVAAVAQQEASGTLPDSSGIADTTNANTDTPPVVVDMKLNTLQGRVGALAHQIDSVKADTIHRRSGVSDTSSRPTPEFLNQKVRDITVLKQEIHRYRQDLSRQANGSTSGAEDSMLLDGPEQDALRELQVGITDSLTHLDRRLDGLLHHLVEIRSDLSKDTLSNGLAQDSSYTATLEAPTTKRVMSSIRRNLDSDKPLNEFFDYAAWSGRVLLILLTLAYCYWMYVLARKGSDSQVDGRQRLFQRFPIGSPLLKALVFFLILLPLTSYVIPILVIQVSYLLIFVALYGIFRRQLTRNQKQIGQVVLAVFVLLSVGNLIVSEALWIRLIVGLLNVVGLLITWKIGQSLRDGAPANHIPALAKWVILLGFTVSVISNAFGYIYLARISSVASSVGLIQALALRTFSQMLLADLEQHYQSVSKENVIRRFDLQRMLSSLSRLISLVGFFIVAIILVNNLNIPTRTADFLQGVLYKDHQLGSITFNYANLLLAILVLWGSNWLQKNLQHLLNDPSSDELQAKRMTLFPLFRLILVVVSFFFAISILGLGLDKLTVIVGALTVGIGFGLQNIINNLVSGVILVFEKPFKIGDYIELADKKGQVLEIGIRSSVLLTDQGAKVIIPNADLFSGRLVNWTFSSTDIRVNLDLSITGSDDIEDVKERLRNRLKNDRYVDKTIPMKVYTKDIQPNTYKVSIQVGIKNVRQIERFRSQFLEGMMKELAAVEIGIASV